MKRLHILYWITGLLFLCLGYYFSGSLNFVDHDAFFKLDYVHTSLVLVIPYVIFGSLTFILFRLKKPINIGLWFHYAVTTLGIVVVSILFHLSIQTYGIKYNDPSVYHGDGSYEIQTDYSRWIGNLALATLLVQLLFISSFIRSILKPSQAG